ncbi:hypothetical protein H0H87_000223, partial [Tephrocybe sp. NHM501043]
VRGDHEKRVNSQSVEEDPACVPIGQFVERERAVRTDMKPMQEWKWDVIGEDLRAKCVRWLLEVGLSEASAAIQVTPPIDGEDECGSDSTRVRVQSIPVRRLSVRNWPCATLRCTLASLSLFIYIHRNLDLNNPHLIHHPIQTTRSRAFIVPHHEPARPARNLPRDALPRRVSLPPLLLCTLAVFNRP